MERLEATLVKKDNDSHLDMLHKEMQKAIQENDLRKLKIYKKALTEYLKMMYGV